MVTASRSKANGSHGSTRGGERGGVDPAVTERVVKEAQGSRKIKVDDEAQGTGTLDMSPVMTNSGDPDMRFAENRNLFLRDPLKKVNGQEDRRFIENRPDIQAVHEKRGDHRPNVIFGDDR